MIAFVEDRVVAVLRHDDDVVIIRVGIELVNVSLGPDMQRRDAHE